METALLTEQPISDAKCIPNLLALTILQQGPAVFAGVTRSGGILTVVTQRNQG
jgi:hypothetical protein